MTNHTTSVRRPVVVATPAVEQLSLLPDSQVTARFRLSRDTRERGLRHVAEIRKMLAERTDRPERAVGSDGPAIIHDRAA